MLPLQRLQSRGVTMTAKPGQTNLRAGLQRPLRAHLVRRTQVSARWPQLAQKLLKRPSKRPEECSPETFLRLLCFFLADRRRLKLELRFRFLRFLLTLLEARDPTKVTSLGSLLILRPIRRNARAFRELLFRTRRGLERFLGSG